MNKTVKIKEQIIEDLTSGLTIEFLARNDGEARMVLKSSTLPFGNREIHFDKEGEYVGAGTWLNIINNNIKPTVNEGNTIENGIGSNPNNTYQCQGSSKNANLP